MDPYTRDDGAPDPVRRELMRRSRDLGVAAAVMTLLGPGLMACRRQEPGAAGGTVALPELEPEPGPYQVWREVQAALRTSPDHAPARARELVREGDPDALLRFVRDEIRLVSSSGNRYFSLGDGSPWGTRVALRAGAGTAREKADLLAELLREAGHDADVVQDMQRGTDPGEKLFFRDFEPAFQPAFSAAQLADWQRRLGRPGAAPAALPEIDPGGRDAAALAGQLLDVLGDRAGRLGPGSYQSAVEGGWPLVRITAPDGSVRCASPVHPDAAWGGIERHRLLAAGAAGGRLKVDITVMATTTDPAAGALTLAEASWPADVIAGRQLRLHFAPAVDFAQLLGTRIGNLRTFTPILAIQSLDGGPVADGHRHVLGSTFTIAGQRIELDDSGGASVDGVPLAGTGGAADPASVQQVAVEADASRYPEIRLLVTPRDGKGDIIDGLPASAFRVVDEGEAAGFTLARNSSAPRVLFLADASASMPEEFIGHGQAIRELSEQVRAHARAVHPDAALEYRQTTSSMWEYLAEAAATPASLIIYATDGDLDGARPDAAMYEALRNGPPALILDVTGRLAQLREEGGDNIFDAMAAATGGEAHAVHGSSADDAFAIIQRVLGAHRPAPVQLGYGALQPAAAGDERTVRVEVGAAAAEATYSVPATPTPPVRLASLRLVVQVGRRRVERVLAGHDGQGRPTPGHQDETLGALLGTHLLAFEGPPPALSVLLDDVLQAKLALEPLDRAAAAAPDLETRLAAMESGLPLLPPELVTLLQRTQDLSGSGHSCTQEGLRVVLHSTSPVINADRVVQRVDILPLEQAGVLAADPAAMRRRAMAGSLGLALAEAAMFPRSTVSLLESRPLALLQTDSFRERDLSAEEKEAWNRRQGGLSGEFPTGAYMIVPEDGRVHAFWTVDHATASVLGVLPDGSGGGRREIAIRGQLQELKAEMERYNELLGRIGGGFAGAAGVLNPAGGMALGVVSAHGQLLVRLYAAASMSIMLMDNSGMEDSVRRALASFACEVTKTIALGGFSGAGKTAAHAVNLFTLADLAASPSPFSCSL